MAPSIVLHHERSATAGPGSASATQEPASKIDSTTMTDPGLSTAATPTLDPSRTWPAPRTQQSFDQSAQVRPCSSQVLEVEEVTLPPVLGELIDDVFVPQPSPAPQPSPRPSRTSSTSRTTSSLLRSIYPSLTHHCIYSLTHYS